MPTASPVAERPVSMTPRFEVSRGLTFGAFALLALAGGALFWAINGSVSTRVMGQGLLVPAGEVVEVASVPVGGTLRTFMVKVGDRVTVGQPLASLHVDDLETQIHMAELAFRQASDDASLSRRQGDAEITRHRRAFEVRRVALTREAARLDVTIRRSTDFLKAQQDLLARGVIVKRDFDAARLAHDDLLAQLENNAVSMASAKVELADMEQQAAEQLRASEEQLERTSAALQDLRQRVQAETIVKAMSNGRVLSLEATVGDALGTGAPLVHVGTQPSNAAGFDAIVFLDAAEGPRAKPGMAAHIVPATAKREEYGAIRGKVIDLSLRPASAQEVDVVVRNEELTQRLMAGGAPLTARVALASARTPSGLDWWVGQGPPFEIKPGTLLQVEIEVERQAPIALIAPALRNLLGS
jgi:HlyD family secretion protein